MRSLHGWGRTLRCIPAPALVLVVSTLVGCGGADSHETVTQDILQATRQLNSVLSQVTDTASARKHADEIMRLVGELRTNYHRGQELDPLPPKRQAALIKRYFNDYQVESLALAEHLNRITQHGDTETADIISSAFEGFESMKGAGPFK